MAEKFTRTIKTTRFDVECIDPITKEFSTLSFHLSGNIDTDKQLEKLRKNFERKDRILLQVVNKEIIEELREMSLDDFIKYSTPVEPRKVVEYK